MMFPPYRWRWTRGAAGWKPQHQLRCMRESPVYFAKLWSARGDATALGGRWNCDPEFVAALPKRRLDAAALQSASHENEVNRPTFVASDEPAAARTSVAA